MPNDDNYWAMFASYVFVTPRQAIQILNGKRITVYVRLKRLYEAGYLGRVRQNDFAEFVYFLTQKGADRCVERLGVNRWYIGKKSLMQIPHDIGITEFQLRLARAFPHMEVRRWRTDLQKDFDGEVPDLYFNIGDGMEWTPFEYVRMNPVTAEKLRDYNSAFKRSYFVLPTEKRVENVLISIEDDLPSSRLWFTDEALYRKDILGKIWWTPKNFRERQYSILKPEKVEEDL
jgi:hypothetical protein